MGSNEKLWSSASPGLLIIMVSRSGSMLAPYEGSTRSKFVTDSVNRMIDYLIEKNFNGVRPLNRFYVSVIGYSNSVKELASGWLQDLCSNPLRIETVKQKVPDGTGGLVEIEKSIPIWIEQQGKGYSDRQSVRDMAAGFSYAKDLCQKWINDNPNYPAPVIINICDGLPFDGKDVKNSMDETKRVVEEIMNLTCEDGHPLIFNSVIGIDEQPKVFPKSKDCLTSSSAKFFFDISSKMPESFVWNGERYGINISNESRACLLHCGSVTELMCLFDFGS